MRKIIPVATFFLDERLLVKTKIKHMKKAFNLFLIIGMSLAVALFVIGSGVISSRSNNSSEEDKFVVGYMGPLTGESAQFGFGAKKAIELAKKDLGANDYKLIYVDTKCQIEAATNGVQKLLADGAQAIIGEVCSSATLAAVPYVDANKVVMISPASTSTELDSISPYFFRTISSDSEQALFAATLLNKEGVDEVSVVYSNESYGKSFYSALKKEFEKLGGVVLSSVAIDQETVYVEDEMKELLKEEPKTVFIISNSPSLAAASVIEIRKNDQNIQFFGSEAMKIDSFLSDAGGSAEESIVISLPESDKSFIRKYKAEFNVNPGVFSSQAYDAFNVIFRAVESGNYKGEDMANFMKNVDFPGVSGQIKFSENNDVSMDYGIYIVKNGKFVKKN